MILRAAIVGVLMGCGVATAAGERPDGLSCRAQVLFSCEATCEEATQPADLSLDLKGGTGSFCRGSGCVEGKLSVLDLKGQWDDAAYLTFALTGGGASPFSVSGIIFQGEKTFAATSNEVGDMAGTCE